MKPGSGHAPETTRGSDRESETVSTVELKHPVIITVLGHPAKIMWLSPAVETNPLVHVPSVSEGVNAYIELDPPVDGTAGFAVSVSVATAANLTATAFVWQIERYATAVLRRILNEHELTTAKRIAREEREAKLQGLADRLAEELGGAKQ